MLCGRFVIAPPHDRLLRSYLLPRLVVHDGNDNFKMVRSATATQLVGPVTLRGGVRPLATSDSGAKG